MKNLQYFTTFIKFDKNLILQEMNFMYLTK